MLELLNKFYQIVHPISKIDYILRKIQNTLCTKLDEYINTQSSFKTLLNPNLNLNSDKIIEILSQKQTEIDDLKQSKNELVRLNLESTKKISD